MQVSGFPTSSDIYLEVDGKKVAVVQSYTAKSTKTSRTVEAFGEDQPDRKVIYSGCQWSAIGETGTLGDMVVEKVTVVAAKRIETKG